MLIEWLGHNAVFPRPWMLQGDVARDHRSARERVGAHG